MGIPIQMATEWADQRNPPRTVDELAHSLGPWSEAATEKAIWNAVLGWLGRRPEAKLDPGGTMRLHKIVTLYSEARSASVGLPSINGGPIEAEYLGFHRSRQSRIKKQALEIRALWKQAGEQCLESSIAYVNGYMRQALARSGCKEPTG